MSEIDFSKNEKAVLEQIGLEMKANKYVSGEMQFTDLTNTLYFLRAYEDSIRYCITWDKFLVWNGTNWEIDLRGFVQERIPIFSDGVVSSLFSCAIAGVLYINNVQARSTPHKKRNLIVFVLILFICNVC